MGNVHPRAGIPGEHHVAGDDDLLGDPGPAGQTEASGQLALVTTGPVVGQLGVLGVLGHHPVEGLDVLQRPAHHPRVMDAPAVIGEDPHPGPRAGHQPQLSELVPGESLGDRPDRLHVDQSGQPPEVQHPLSRLCGIGDRCRVGHGQDRGEAADRRGGRTAGNGLGILTTRLTQVGVQVDQAWQRDQTVRVDGLVDGLAGSRRVDVQHADLGDHAIADQQVLASGTDQVRTLDQQVHVSDPSPANKW